MSMSSFEDMAAQRRLPDEGMVDDMESLWQRRRTQEAERKSDEHEQEREDLGTEQVADEREAVLARGGSGAGGDQGAISEPLPQREDPDEGEHTSSEAEPEESAQVDEPEEQEGPADEPEPDAVEDIEEEPLAEDEQVEESPIVIRVPEPPATMPEGAQPLDFHKNVGFGFTGDEDKGATAYVRSFPVAILDALRSQLASFGEEFAAGVSNTALITAFISVRLGVDLPGLDANTLQAARAFSLLTPELASLEQRIDTVGHGLSDTARAVELLRKDVARIGQVAETIELSNALVVTDRYEQIVAPNTTGSTVELRHPRVLATRSNLAKQTKSLAELEKRREGRPKR